MQIVIDIPEDHKRVIDKLVTDGKGYLLPYEVEDTLAKAVRNGIPLPEHHGRLIDISEYEKYFNTAITYDDGNHNHTVYTNMIPTIIEADRGE